MASDLGLHCLPTSHKKDARLVWVKQYFDTQANFNLNETLKDTRTRLIESNK